MELNTIMRVDQPIRGEIGEVRFRGNVILQKLINDSEKSDAVMIE